jgi:sigma-B regulation protein RsbQ
MAACPITLGCQPSCTIEPLELLEPLKALEPWNLLKLRPIYCCPSDEPVYLTVQMEIQTDVLKRNNVKIMGNAEKTLLFAHGFGCDQNSWKYIVNEFTDDYKVVLFDYVGAGNSDLGSYDPEKYGSLDGYVQDVIEICQTLHLPSVTFVGHSVSCMIGLLAAIKSPGIFEALILIGPSPCYRNDGEYQGGFEPDVMDALFEVMEEDYISWAKLLAPNIMGKGPGTLVKELEGSFCAIDPAIAKQFARVTFLSDNRKDLPLVKTKSLTIQCTNDNIAPLAVGEYMHEHLPHNTLVLLEAQTHCPHMSYPQLTVAAMRNYLSAKIYRG